MSEQNRQLRFCDTMDSFLGLLRQYELLLVGIRNFAIRETDGWIDGVL